MPRTSGQLVRRSFLGGMSFAVNDNIARSDAVRFANNMLPRPLGAWTTRDARQRRYNIDPDANAVRALDVWRYRSSGGDRFDIVTLEEAGQNRLTVASGSGFTDVITGLTAGARTVAAQLKDRLILCNGADTVRVYRYSGAAHQGRAAGLGSGPALTGVTPAMGTGSIPSSPAVYDYVLTVQFDGDGETNAGAKSTATMGATDNEVALTWSAPTPPVGMTIGGYRIWRKRTDSGNVWDTYYLVDSVASGTTSYTDRKDDATVYAAAAGTKIHDNHNAPPSGSVGVVFWNYENRAVYWGAAANPNRLHFSDVGFPEQVRTADDTVDTANLEQFIDVPQDDPGNDIVAVVPYERFLYVFNRYGVRQVIATGDSAVPYVVSDVANSEDQGILGPQAAVAADTGEVYYLSTTGMRAIRGRVDAAVDPNNSDGSLVLTNRPAASKVGDPVSELVQRIKVSLRKHVKAAIFNDLVHFAIPAKDDQGTDPAHNNDILIFDLQTRGFCYRRDAKVAGMTVVNDDTGDYKLVSVSSEAGMIFNEYVDGQLNDHPATGAFASMATQQVAWEIQDFYRPLADYETALLRRFVLDAGQGEILTDQPVSVEASVDGGRFAKLLTFNYKGGQRRVWTDAGYLITNGMNTTLGDWTAVTDGEFSIDIDGTTYNVTGLDFSSAADFEAVATVIQAGIRAATGGSEWAAWTGAVGPHPNEIKIASDGEGTGSSAANLATVPYPAGTDLTGAMYLNAPADEFTFTTPSDTVLVFGDEFDAAAQFLWSRGPLDKARPADKAYDGLKAQQLRITIFGEGPFSVYGYRVEYWRLPVTAHGAN